MRDGAPSRNTSAGILVIYKSAHTPAVWGTGGIPGRPRHGGLEPLWILPPQIDQSGTLISMQNLPAQTHAFAGKLVPGSSPSEPLHQFHPHIQSPRVSKQHGFPPQHDNRNRRTTVNHNA